MDKNTIPIEQIEIIKKLLQLKENRQTTAHLQIPHKLLEI